MHSSIAYETQKLLLQERLRDAELRSLRAPVAQRPRHRRRRSVLAAAIAALALAAVPSLASAQSLNSVAIATNSSGITAVLDVSGAATWPGAPVIQWWGNFGSNQRWNLAQLPDGNEHIVNQNSGMCLTTDGVAGDQVYQEPCGEYVTEEWQGTLNRVFSRGNTLKNPWSGLYLDVSGNSGWPGAPIITWYYDGTNGEYFQYYQLS